MVDCADSDCDTASACGSNSNNANANANANNNNNNPGPEFCTNGVDDDGDTLADCDDPDCSAAPTCQAENCTNGVDDNADGLADCDDPDCSAEPTCQVENCTNGVDDNADGLADCDDPDCSAEPTCQVETCDSGVDDDLDGLVDCDDVDDCLGTAECGPCHPINNAGCATGTTCYLTHGADWFGGCQSGSGSGGQWSYCDEATDCQAGYYCSGSYYICLRVCHPGGTDCAAVIGTHCKPFGDYGSASPWGVCVN